MNAVDDIPEELLNQLPELDGQRRDPPRRNAAPGAPANPPPLAPGAGPAAPFAGLDAARAFPPLPTFAPSTGAASPADADLLGTLADVRRNMEAAFQHEMDRMENSFGAILRQTDARLVQANLDLASARAEMERVKAEHARKADTLRELKRALEGL